MRRINLLVTFLGIANLAGCGAANHPMEKAASSPLVAQPADPGAAPLTASEAVLGTGSLSGLATALAVVEIHTADGSTKGMAMSGSLRQALIESLCSLEVAVVPGSERLTDLKAALSHSRAMPLIVTANLVSLSQSQADGMVSWEATVTMSLSDHPGGSLRAVLTERAAVSRESRFYRASTHEKAMQQRAVSEAARAISKGIVVSLSVL